MSSDLFVYKEHEETLTNLSELQAYYSTLNRKSRFVDNLSSLKFSQGDDGKLQLDFGEGIYKVSRVGYESLCKILKVPVKFIDRLPYENTIKDLYASLFTCNLVGLSVIFDPEKQIIWGVSVRKEPIMASRVVDSTFAANHKTIREIGLQDEKLVLNVTTEDGIDLGLDDTFGLGFSVIHNSALGTFPDVKCYIYRLVCSNGAISKDLMSFGRFSGRLETPKFYKVYEERLEKSMANASMTLVDSLNQMKNSIVKYEEKDILNRFLKRKMKFNEYEGEDKFERIIKTKDVTHYDLFNFITNYAKDMDQDSRVKVQMLGGEMISYFKPMNNSSELFNGYAEFYRKSLAKN